MAERKLSSAMLESALSRPSKKGVSKSAKEKKRLREIHTRHVKGGFIAKHRHEAPHDMPEHDEEHVVPDMAGLLAHIKEHMGGVQAAHEAAEPPAMESAEQEGAAEAAANQQ
jgi:hypothetical protein